MSDMFFLCPNCGERVDFERKSCPKCGSDDETGWSPNTLYDDIDLPEREDEPPLPTLKNTLLWKDLKWLVMLALLLAVFFLGLRF